MSSACMSFCVVEIRFFLFVFVLGGFSCFDSHEKFLVSYIPRSHILSPNTLFLKLSLHNFEKLTPVACQLSIVSYVNPGHTTY